MSTDEEKTGKVPILKTKVFVGGKVAKVSIEETDKTCHNTGKNISRKVIVTL